MKDLDLSFCDKNITPFGGMVLMKKMMDHLGFPSLLKSLPLPQPKSNRGYDPTQLMMQFMISVWCGANAYEQCEIETNSAAFNWSKPPCLIISAISKSVSP